MNMILCKDEIDISSIKNMHPNDLKYGEKWLAMHCVDDNDDAYHHHMIIYNMIMDDDG